MYFFYFDESGSRDPSVGTMQQPKDHLYVLLAVGMFEGHWRPFDLSISRLKLELADYLRRDGKGQFDLADCEVKSNWIRNPGARDKKSPFLAALDDNDRSRLVETYLRQLVDRKLVVMAVVVDKRHLYPNVTHEGLHTRAYEYLLERIQHFMRDAHPKHRAVIVMDDTSLQLNRAVALRHARFQRAGNQNMQFPAITEYPFFTRSELSNGVQLADLLAYSVYRAFKDEDLHYDYFRILLPHIYRRSQGHVLNGLKVWPDASPLVRLARDAWMEYRQGGSSDQ